MNALSAFNPADDGTAPTIEELKFRGAPWDEPGANTVTDERLKLRKETPRANAKYFTTTTTVGTETFTIAGLQPDPWGGGTFPANSSAGIDIVAKMYDRYGLAATPGTRKLNIATTSFFAVSRRWNASTGTIASFNFKSIIDPSLVDYTYFLNFNRTRSIYSNDTTSNSGMVEPFFYTVTNTPSRTDAFAAGGVFPDGARANYWTTNALVGEPWNTGNLGKKSTNNANSEYPDDLYDIYVTATDLSDNSTFKTKSVLLDNWRQTISTEMQMPFVAGGDIVVGKGEQFRANQELKFYLLPGPMIPVQLENGSALPAAGLIGTIQTDAKGAFKNAKFERKAPAAGGYWLVADYNGDGEFTSRLDAVVRIAVNPAKPANPALATPDAYNWSHGWAMEIGAPGVLPSDESPNWSDTTAILHSGPSHGTLDLRPDGSFTYVPSGGSAYPDEFYYKLRVGTETTGEVAVFLGITNDPPVANDDEVYVVHDTSLHLSVADGPLRNDIDSDDDALTAITSLQTLHGTATLHADGSFDYVPDAGFVGTDLLGYHPADGTGSGDGANITIHVTNEAPDPTDEYYVAPAGQTLVVPAAQGVRINDLDEEEDPITVSLPNIPELAPEHGTVVLSADGSFSYTPVTGYTGYDWFFYTPTDGMTPGELGLVTLFVTNGAQIGDEVWYDLNEDGIQDTGEPGIENIPVELLNSSGIQIADTLTDEFGRYLFDVAPGAYQVRLIPPTWASLSPINSGADDTEDSDFSLSGTTVLFSVANGESNYDVDGGMIGTMPPPPSSIGGSVWMDMNADGIRNTSEMAMGGITVNLLDATGLIVATTVTAMDGTYSFTNVAAGQYRVQFVPMMGYSFTTANQGSDESLDSDVTDSVAGTTDLFTVSGGSDLDVTAGLCTTM